MGMIVLCGCLSVVILRGTSVDSLCADSSRFRSILVIDVDRCVNVICYMTCLSVFSGGLMGGHLA